MINNIMGGRGITVSTSSSPSYIARSYGSNPSMTGQMMYDTENQCIKVFDGHNWQSLYSGTTTITLDPDTVSLLEWARQKKYEEEELKRLAQTNPAVKDLINEIKKKEEQLKIVQTLIK